MYQLTLNCLKKFLAIKQMLVLEYPAYSPDLTPMSFFLFPKIKKH